MAEVTKEDIVEVTNALGLNELQHLLDNLHIAQRDQEIAEKGADTTDPILKARAVLRWWRKKRGKHATRQALIEAKEKAILMGNRNLSSSGGIFLQLSYIDVDTGFLNRTKWRFIICVHNQILLYNAVNLLNY